MPDLEPDTVSALEAPEFAPAQFVRWFRDVAPYVHAFRGKTFVVAFGGELVQAGALNAGAGSVAAVLAGRRGWCWYMARAPR